MSKLKICRSRSFTALKKLNEAAVENGKKKYVFQGVFTACSTPNNVIINRNNRSYPEKEVLKHLSYLRDAIKQNGSLLGELDHPEGRFDVQLKEASHKITDIWYDTNTHCVMGKIELLDTPNGKIAKELVDAGYPLFVSSRAAGDVDEKTHEVEIAQIFTYDIVCTPGFAEARLEQVNEKLSVYAQKFINETVYSEINHNSDRAIALFECDENFKVDKKIQEAAARPVKLNDLIRPLLEEDEFVLPEAETDPNKIDKDEKEEKDSKDEKDSSKKEVKDESPEKTKEIDKDDDISENDEEDKKAEKRELILNIKAEDKEGDEPTDDNESDKDSKEDTAEKREKILGITAEEFDGEEEEKEDKPTDEDSKDDKETSDEDEDAIDECDARRKKIADDADKTIAELEDLLNSVEKIESVRESIIRRYPFAISLSEDNFARFAALRPQQKKKCNDFIVEHAIFDIQSINELWHTPLQAEKRVQKNWLKLASQRDIDLYCNAPKHVQDAIEESAKYVILETQEEVDRFWQKTGLRQAAARKM